MRKSTFQWFYQAEEESIKWEKEAFRLNNLNDDDAEIKFWQGAKNYFTEYCMRSYINQVFAFDGNPDGIDYLKKILTDNGILVAQTQNSITFNYYDRQFVVDKLSGCSAVIAKEFPQIERIRDRAGECHQLSLNTALILKKDATIATGYTYGLSDKARYMHSWVEFTQNGKKYAIDPTLNAVFKIENFYDLFHAEKLTALSWKQVKEDYYWLRHMSDLDYKEYFIFHDEIKRDIEKKPKSFWDEKEA